MTARLNVLQMLIRQWERCHPYNAAQAVHVRGSADPAAWTLAWGQCVATSGLGPVVVEDGRYFFARPETCPLLRLTVSDRCAFDRFVSAELNRPFHPGELPLRPFLLDCPHSAAPSFYVGIVYQHWLADSISIRMLLGDWLNRLDPAKPPRAGAFVLPRCGYWAALGPSRNGWDATEALLSVARRHTRLRQAKKVHSAHLADHRTRFATLDAPPGLARGLRDGARRRGVTVNDLLLAALAEACAAHVPLQVRPKRRDLAVASIVDLRQFCRDDLSNTFGLYLGFTNVVCRPQQWTDFERLLRAVANQTRHQKRNGVAGASLTLFGAAAILGRLSRPDELYHFYRKELPLAGGLSNVHLDRAWPEARGVEVLEYLRISPTGPMTPLALTVTTVGDHTALGLTHRSALLSPARAAELAGTLLGRLRMLSNLNARSPNGSRQNGAMNVKDSAPHSPPLA